MKRDDPARMVDGPGASVAAGGDRASQGTLQVTAFHRRVDLDLDHSATEIRSQDRPIG
jgi:hypothetical protein